MKPRVLGIPVISIAGVVTFVLFGILIYGFLENSVFGANSTKDLFFFGGLWVVGLIGYGIARWVRHSQGVPLEAAFKELPRE